MAAGPDESVSHYLQAPEDVAKIHAWATRAWTEMKDARVLPNPRNFALWYVHASGANAEISQQIAIMLAQQTTISAVAMEGLHARFPTADLDKTINTSSELKDAAQTMLKDLAANSAQLDSYGDTLLHWTKRLGQDRSLGEILHAITTLAVETTRASERNEALQQRLSASSARISRLKENLAEVKREATTDSLTGLCNRKLFGLRLRRAMTQAKEDNTAVSLILLDVDHFKAVNDSYGHHAGDLVLRRIGRLLADSVRGRDTAARYGGEEFAIILLGATLDMAMRFANTIRIALQSKNVIKRHVNDRTGAITASFGVAALRADDTLNSLIDRADAALYQAKALGRNQVCGETTLAQIA